MFMVLCESSWNSSHTHPHTHASTQAAPDPRPYTIRPAMKCENRAMWCEHTLGVIWVIILEIIRFVHFYRTWAPTSSVTYFCSKPFSRMTKYVCRRVTTLLFELNELNMHFTWVTFNSAVDKVRRNQRQECETQNSQRPQAEISVRWERRWLHK